MPDRTYPIYGGCERDLFAFRCMGMIVEECITEERVFELIESFYVPEDEDFEIEYWDRELHPPQWVKVV